MTRVSVGHTWITLKRQPKWRSCSGLLIVKMFRLLCNHSITSRHKSMHFTVQSMSYLYFQHFHKKTNQHCWQRKVTQRNVMHFVKKYAFVVYCLYGMLAIHKYFVLVNCKTYKNQSRPDVGSLNFVVINRYISLFTFKLTFYKMF